MQKIIFIDQNTIICNISQLFYFQNEDNMDPPMFFGFVGLFSTVLLWPLLFILHTAQQEPFQMPTVKQWEFLIVNGVIGTVLSELLWLLGCFYTSSLIATLSIGLTIPLSIIADIVWKQKEYHIIFVIGAIPMFVSFFIIALLTHYQDWDPLLDLFQNIGRQCQRLFCCGRGNLRSGYQRSRDRAGTSGYIFDRQERESLIGQNDCDNELTNSSENSNEMNSDHLLISQECNEHNFGHISASDISESEPM